SGSSSDPSLAYSIAPGKTLSFADLLPAMGLPSGLGSADLLADATSALPVALSRVFNDAGANGTTGLAQEALPAEEALQQGNGSAVCHLSGEMASSGANSMCNTRRCAALTATVDE